MKKLNQLYTLSFGECIIGLIGVKIRLMKIKKTTWFASTFRTSQRARALGEQPIENGGAQ